MDCGLVSLANYIGGRDKALGPPLLRALREGGAWLSEAKFGLDSLVRAIAA